MENANENVKNSAEPTRSTAGQAPRDRLILRHLRATPWFALGEDFEVRDAAGALRYRSQFHILESTRTFTLDILDAAGQVVVVLCSTEPFNGRATGAPLMGWSIQREGQPDISVENRLLANEQEIVLKAGGAVLLRAHAHWPNRDYAISDTSGAQVARVTREGKGLSVTSNLDVFTTPNATSKWDESLLVAITFLTNLLNQWHTE